MNFGERLRQGVTDANHNESLKLQRETQAAFHERIKAEIEETVDSKYIEDILHEIKNMFIPNNPNGKDDKWPDDGVLKEEHSSGPLQYHDGKYENGEQPYGADVKKEFEINKNREFVEFCLRWKQDWRPIGSKPGETKYHRIYITIVKKGGARKQIINNDFAEDGEWLIFGYNKINNDFGQENIKPLSEFANHEDGFATKVSIKDSDWKEKFEEFLIDVCGKNFDPVSSAK